MVANILRDVQTRGDAAVLLTTFLLTIFRDLTEAIVIGFATTALFLVVLLALRGLSGGDHVDGQEEHP